MESPSLSPIALSVVNEVREPPTIETAYHHEKPPPRDGQNNNNDPRIINTAPSMEAMSLDSQNNNKNKMDPSSSSSASVYSYPNYLSFPHYPNVPSLPPHHHHHPYQQHSNGVVVPPAYSFDSRGSYPPQPYIDGNYGHGQQPGGGPPPPPHYYMQYPPPPTHSHPHVMEQTPLEFVMDPQPSDVLSGRGGATNSHSGNRAFRSLVKEYQGRYLLAKKKDKPAVAAEVVEKVREVGGRFLRRHHATAKGVVWVDIGDEKAKEKTCQALREGAPEIRRRKEAGSSRKGRSSAPTDFPTSTTDRSSNGDKEGSYKESPYRHTTIVRITTSSEDEERSGADLTDALVIRPSMILICKPNQPPISWSVDQLDSSDRELYLRDYFPPNPAANHSRSDGGNQAHSFDYIVGHRQTRGGPTEQESKPEANLPDDGTVEV